MIPTRFATGLLAAAALASSLLAQGPLFKRALPAHTIGFLSAPDLQASAAEFDGSALAKMWHEDEMQDFISEGLVMLQQEWETGLKELEEMYSAGGFPISPADLLNLRLDGLGIALTRLEVGSEPTTVQQLLTVGVLVHLDLGESAAVWKNIVDFALASLQQEAGGEVETTTATIAGGVDLTTLSMPGTDMSINVAIVGNNLVLGTLTDEVKTFVAALQEGGAGTDGLSANANYRATENHLSPAGAELEAYLDLDAIADFAISGMRILATETPDWPVELSVDGLERAITAFGLRSIKTLGLTSSYEDEKTVTRLFAYAPEAERKGIFAGEAKNVDMSFLKWVPVDATSVSAMRLDTGVVYSSLVAALRANDPQMADAILGQLSAVEQEFGVNVEEDLFGALGDQIVWWSEGIQNLMAPTPDMAIVVAVSDEERLLANLLRASEMSQGLFGFPSSERRGVKTWRLDVNPVGLDPEILQVVEMATPSFTFKDGYLVVAFSPGDVRKAVQRMDREDDPKGDIRSHAEFKAYLGTLDQQQVQIFAWQDWRVGFENAYSAAATMLNIGISADQLPVDLTLLPEAETLSQHLFSSLSWISQGPDGFTSTSFSPIGPEILALVAVGVGAVGWLVVGEMR